MRVMYVDDMPDQLYALQQALEDNNVEFIGANSGKECLQKLQVGQLPDLIFLDIMMDDISGWELFDILKSNPLYSSIPIYFLTARTDTLAKDKGIQLADGFIEKPFDMDRIMKCIHDVEQNIKDT